VKLTPRLLFIQISRLFTSLGSVPQSSRVSVLILTTTTGGRGGFFFSVRRSGWAGSGKGGIPSAPEALAGYGGGARPQGPASGTAPGAVIEPNSNATPSTTGKLLKGFIGYLLADIYPPFIIAVSHPGVIILGIKEIHR